MRRPFYLWLISTILIIKLGISAAVFAVSAITLTMLPLPELDALSYGRTCQSQHHGLSIQGAFAMLSARNQLPATIVSVKLGNVMAEVVMSVGDVEIVSVITRGSAEQLGLKAGDAVKAIIKSTEVMIDKS
jgi:molybdopterin-binding protein